MSEVITDKENDVKPKKKRKILGSILNWFFIGIIAIFVVYIGVRVIDNLTGYRFPFFGFRSSVIVSESMAHANPENTYLTDDMKRIDKYDVIVTKDYRSYEDIELYDVVTYLSDDTLICHRVVKLYESDGKKFIVTRGDSNNSDDTPFEYNAIRGEVVNNLKGIGHVVLFLQSYQFLFALFGSAFFVVLGIFIYRSAKDKEEKKKLENKNEEHKDIN